MHFRIVFRPCDVCFLWPVYGLGCEASDPTGFGIEGFDEVYCDAWVICSDDFLQRSRVLND